MSGKNRDQRRKDKLVQRAKKERERQRDAIVPYEGEKYRSQEWVPYVSETEIAVYEAIVQSGKKITNPQVKAAFESLGRHLRDGQPALLPEGTPEVALIEGSEVDFLMWNIRRHWGIAFAKDGPVSTDDLIGILRTLLFSMEAQAWHSGPDLGYVAFIYKFFRDYF